MVVRVGFSYFVLYQRGATAGPRYTNLFIAASVFIGPAVMASVLTISSKIRLMARATKHRQAAAEQRSKRLMSHRSLRKSTRMSLHNLAQLLVLRHDQHVHDESKRANDRSRFEGYGYMLGLVVEDVPFTVVNTIFLLHTVDDISDPAAGSLCAVAYDRERCRKAIAQEFTVMLVVLLSSMAALMYKLMRLLVFPGIWRERIRLLKEKKELAERWQRLEAVPTIASYDSQSDSDDGSQDLCDEAVRAVAADPTMCAGRTNATAGVQQKVVAEVTTFEIGVFPECGR
jgi:hypothetical protein